MQGKTEVLVQDGSNTMSYVLDENLIDFGSALEARDYDRYTSLRFHVLLDAHYRSTSALVDFGSVCWHILTPDGPSCMTRRCCRAEQM